ncbi:MAG: class I tRNA ligase family protein [Candidatus Heimdallarchaeaceae archaeon]
MLSSVKTNLKKALEEIEKFNARDYILDGYYANIRILDDYQKLAVNLPEEEKMAVLREVIEMIVVIIAPVIPHICEELNERMGNKDYISLKRMPKIKIDKEDTLYALQAKFMTNLLEDINQIVKLVKTKPNKIYIYINAEWKNDLYDLATDLFKDEAVQIGRIMSSAKENSKLNKYMKEIANDAKQMLKDPTIFRIKMLAPEDQKKAIQGYEEYISKRFNNAEIIIQIADDKEIHDPQSKANKARPMKPALLLE